MHINCAATDVPYLMGSARDGGWDLTKARECVEKKCPDYMNGTTSEIGSNESASMHTFILMKSLIRGNESASMQTSVFNELTDKGESLGGRINHIAIQMMYQENRIVSCRIELKLFVLYCDFCSFKINHDFR